MIPSLTHKIVGPGQIRQAHERFPEDDYLLGHTEIRELAILAVRLNSKMTDPDELRDWQNRLNSIANNALPSRGVQP